MDTLKIQQLFDSELKVIHIGPSVFSKALEKQGVSVMQVDWVPPAGGDTELQELLKIMGGLE